MHLDLDGQGALQQQLVRALEAAIRHGRLPPGARLPTSRDLARDLRIARNTATLALEEIVARGLARPEPRRGLFVNAQATPADPGPASAAAPVKISRHLQPLVDEATRRDAAGVRHELSYGQPLVPPALWTAWRQALAKASERLPPDYPDPVGAPALRRATATWLAARRGLRVDADDIVIVSGAQQAFSLIARVLIDEGDVVAIEDPHYDGARLAFAAAGARFHACAVDDEGLVVAQLPEAGARLVYITPSHQFPTGALLSPSRRAALLDWATRCGALVIEDDYDGEFRYGAAPAPALHALAGGRGVIYVGTWSKLLFPALRLGYVVVPPALRPAFAAAKRIDDRGSGVIEQLAVASLVAGGTVERHLRRLARELERRRLALTDALHTQGGGRITVEGIAAGMHVVARLHGVPWSRFEALRDAARAAGVNLDPVRPQFLPATGDVAVLLGYSAAPPAAIAEAARLLCRIVAG